jgi:transcriptional regulator with XRE-family HTH domain
LSFGVSKAGFPEDILPATTASRFGTLLRECRKRAGLSQQQLSDYLAVSPKRVSNWETGVSDPPHDPAFYESLRTVPGFSEADITLLLEARDADRATEGLRKLLDQLKATLERLRNPQLGSSIEVRRKGLVRKNAGGLAGIEAVKANRDREILAAHHLNDLGGFAASGKKYIMNIMEDVIDMDNDASEELQPIGQALTEIINEELTGTFAESLTMIGELGFQENALATKPGQES